MSKSRRDYCTCAPDTLASAGYIGDLCQRHDIAYAAGGNKADRLRADRRLRDGIYARAYARGKAWRGWAASRMYYRWVRCLGMWRFRWWE